MGISYDSKREPVSGIIEAATKDATYLLPDLQRPYVWTPRQVTLLMDSLFKGWPFGALLIWEVQPDCYKENEGIPHRPFWKVVDRVKPDESTANSKKEQPATYFMVLDGQQRIQSLLLALGGDEWGFKLYNHEWAFDIHEKRMRKGKHWSKATLCIDVQAFERELEMREKVRKISVGEILKWVITDSETGQSTNNKPANYEHPLQAAHEHPNKFIRLSRIWSLAEKGLSESDYRDILCPFLDEHLADEKIKERMLQPLAEFMTIVEKVKNHSFVHALKIESFKMTPQWTKDDYNDAIVNIFTRLNTAGRTLTREEITLAWLKVDWLATESDDKTAGECLAELQDSLREQYLGLTIDELVRLISFIWSVNEREGNLLDSRDLLKGDIIRPMSKYVSGMWKQLNSDVNIAAIHLNRRGLTENITSKNAVIVFMTWLHLAKEWRREHGLKVKDDDDYEKKIRILIDSYLDRWLFASQWSTVWSVNAVQNFRAFAEKLSNTRKALRSISGYENAVGELSNVFARLIDDVKDEATRYVRDLTVPHRSKVYRYRSLLWVWHRLDATRWKMSEIQMRLDRIRAKNRLEVDHTVADAYWKRLIDSEIKKKLDGISISADDEAPALTVEVSPDGFESKDEAVSFINTVGNCALLEKSFNISKSDEPMWYFLKDVHEFKEGRIERGKWEDALAIPSEMTNPIGVEFGILTEKIRDRDRRIREEICEFIDGKLGRKDV